MNNARYFGLNFVGLIKRIRTRTVLFGVLLLFSSLLVFSSYMANRYQVKMSFNSYIRVNNMNVSYELEEELITYIKNNNINTNEWSGAFIRKAYSRGVFTAFQDANSQIVFDNIGISKLDRLNKSLYREVLIFDSLHYFGKMFISVQDSDGILSTSYNSFLMYNRRHSMIILIISLGLALLLSFVLADYLSRPVSNIKDSLSRFRLHKDTLYIADEGTLEIVIIKDALKEMVNTLDKHEKWRQSLLDDLSHELRTPFSIISFQLEGIVEGVYEPTLNRIDSIYSETKRLAKLFDEIQKLQKAEGAHFEMNCEVSDICVLVRSIAEQFYLPCKQKDIQISLDYLLKPYPIFCDIEKIKQVMFNIISNAYKYTEAGGQIKIIIRSSSSELIEISIRDTGIGISEEELSNIFKRFYRIKSQLYQRVEGFGLGLAISKSLVEAHKGDISVISRINNGSTFIIKLPTGFDIAI